MNKKEKTIAPKVYETIFEEKSRQKQSAKILLEKAKAKEQELLKTGKYKYVKQGIRELVLTKID